MVPALKAELRKLLTVRSTYFLTGLLLAIVAFVMFYAIGWRALPPDLADKFLIRDNVVGASHLVGLLAAVVSILLVAHEYRYNTIMYTLTASNSRSKVLLAKAITATLYALFLVFAADVLGLVLIKAGVAAHGHTLTPQTLYISHLLRQTVFFVWSYAMYGVILITLLRNLVGAIVALLFLPTIEQLLGLLLKNNVSYLPFDALNNVILFGGNKAIFSLTKTTVIVVTYVVVGLLASWILFLKRDAN